MSRMKLELSRSVEGLYLFVFAADEDQPFHGMLQSLMIDGACSPAPGKTSLLRYLYLTLTFPNGSSFTARALPNTNRLGMLFNTFFPSDTGPLPVENTSSTKESASMEEGMKLLLPFNLAALQTIQATFLFLPEREG